MMHNFITSLRGWLETPFKHGVALKGYGADCVQFVLAVAKEENLIDSNYQSPKYHQDWASHNNKSLLENELKKFATSITMEEIKEGDLIVIKYGKCGSHLAVYTGNGRIIHAMLKSSVREDDIKHYFKRITSIWRLKQC